MNNAHCIYNAHRNDAADFPFNGAARRAAFAGAGEPNVDSRVPVIVIEGDLAPVLEGAVGGYRTLSGEPIRHPGAYGRRGWSNMRYHTDSRKVRVGRNWYPSCYGGGR